MTIINTVRDRRRACSVAFSTASTAAIQVFSIIRMMGRSRQSGMTGSVTDIHWVDMPSRPAFLQQVLSWMINIIMTSTARTILSRHGGKRHTLFHHTSAVNHRRGRSCGGSYRASTPARRRSVTLSSFTTSHRSISDINIIIIIPLLFHH